MVGELGSTFKHAGGGVSSWIHETIGPKMAYYAGWTYWVVHMPYISQKPNSTVIAASWALFQDKRASGMNTTVMQILCLVIFLFAMYLSGKGMGVLKFRHVHHVHAVHCHDGGCSGPDRRCLLGH